MVSQETLQNGSAERNQGGYQQNQTISEQHKSLGGNHYGSNTEKHPKRPVSNNEKLIISQSTKNAPGSCRKYVAWSY